MPGEGEPGELVFYFYAHEEGDADPDTAHAFFLNYTMAMHRDDYENGTIADRVEGRRVFKSKKLARLITADVRSSPNVRRAYGETDLPKEDKS